MSSVAAKRLAEPLKWEFCSNGRARSNTIRITLSPGLANDVRLSIGHWGVGNDGRMREIGGFSCDAKHLPKILERLIRALRLARSWKLIDEKTGAGAVSTSRSHRLKDNDDGVIRIEHAITDDFPDGSPTFPLGDDESLWALVAPLPDGRTLWRRICLQNTVLPIGVAGETVNDFRRHKPKGYENET